MADLFDQANQEQLEGQQIETNGEDTLLSELRGMFQNLPEGVDRAGFQQYVIEQQELAAQAATLRQQNEEFKQMLAAQLQQQQNPAPTPAQQQQAEVKRRYEAARQVSPNLKPYLTANFVTTDGAGNYVPLYDPEKNIDFRFTNEVKAACQEMNESLRSQQRIIEDFTRNPYEVGEELVSNSSVVSELRKQMAEMKTQFEERVKAYESQLTPLQQHTQEQQMLALINQNMEWLTQPDPTSPTGHKWTPAGDRFAELVRSTENGGFGMDPQKALEFCRPLAGLKPPAPKKQPVVNRLVPHLNRNGAVRNPELGTRQPTETMPARPTWSDLGQAVFAEEE